MKMTRILSILILSITWICGNAQVTEKPGNQLRDSVCISSMEYKLYTMINAYRQRYDLPPIPLSKSLCQVASTHVSDLYFHHPDQGSCNAHSWSDKGSWKPFCYPRDENKKNSVWDKPKELTKYRGKGYEIVYYENDAVVIDSIIAFWKSMDYFNSFLMNNGKWQGKSWNAIGIGIHENYASAWFGELPDPQGAPSVCGQETQKRLLPEENEPAPAETTQVDSNPIDKKPAEKKDGIKTTPSDNPKIVKMPDPIEVSTIPSGKEYYYIIVKGIAPDKELERFLKDLHSKGYSSARMLDKNGKRRISILEFAEKSRADSALRQIKKTWADAWILKQ
jgi:hypothetical protein